MAALQPARARALLAGTALLLASAVAAQEFPGRPVRVLVGYGPGSPVDLAARSFGQPLAKYLGQPVVIDNRAGASGLLAHQQNATAEASGHTLLFAASPAQTIVPHLQKELNFDPVKDYTPITSVAVYALALVVNKSLPVKNISELVARAKAEPGKLTYASAGMGSSNHLAAELLASRTGTSMLHVPYKDSAAAITDVISGRVAFMFSSAGDVVPYANAGNVSVLAVTSKARNAALPNTPTMIESGLANFDITGWFALEGPPRLPAAVVARLNKAARDALAEPELVKALNARGLDVAGSTAEQLGAQVQADFTLWGGVARSAKLK